MWEYEGLVCRLVTAEDGWEVSVGDRTLGRLELVETGAGPRHWRIQDPADRTMGVGASWGHWQDALISLVDYRRGRGEL